MPHAQSSKPDEIAAAADGSFHLIVRNERLWWPFRTVCEALLQMQSDRAAILAIRRKMVAEAAAILRLEKAMVSDLSAKVLERASPDQDDWKRANDHFDHAIECVRELGETVIKMQIDALEAMRDNSRKLSGGDRAADTPRKMPEPGPALPKRPRDGHSRKMGAHPPKDRVFPYAGVETGKNIAM